MHLCLHRRLDIAYRRVAQKDITYLRAEQAGAVRACHAGQPQQLEPPLNQIGARPVSVHCLFCHTQQAHLSGAGLCVSWSAQLYL